MGKLPWNPLRFLGLLRAVGFSGSLTRDSVPSGSTAGPGRRLVAGRPAAADHLPPLRRAFGGVVWFW